MNAEIRETHDRVLRWEVYYPAHDDHGTGTHTLHFTRLGARLSRWLWGASASA
jgi:hypothetical protein